MRAPVPLLLLLAACGARNSSSSAFEDAEALRRAPGIVVVAFNATVRVRSGPDGRIDATLRWRGADRNVAWSYAEIPGEGITVRPDADLAKQVGTELDVTAPAGMAVQVLGGKGPVDVSGAWSRLRVLTEAGAITAHVDRADSGELRSHSGGVEFVGRGAGPTGELPAKSTSGNVAVTLPAAWKGQLKFQTQTGTLDVPTHKNLATIWDEDKRGAVGRMGPPRRKETPPAPGGVANMGGEPGAGQPAPLPTVWAVSATGDVSFRVAE
ncbi:MAG TPA: hypothetical protein VFY93_19780 [Planctomycetota bacterium]|nr:hypothetical protein [Planctomycetota bacterium]